MNNENNKEIFDADTIYKNMILPLGSVNNPIFPYTFPSLKDTEDKNHKYY